MAGFDIGGANIKAADGRGGSIVNRCNVADWKRPRVIAHIKASTLPPYAVTMTGEIAVAFLTAARVKRIIGSCSIAAGKNEVVFYVLMAPFSG